MKTDIEFLRQLGDDLRRAARTERIARRQSPFRQWNLARPSWLVAALGAVAVLSFAAAFTWAIVTSSKVERSGARVESERGSAALAYPNLVTEGEPPIPGARSVTLVEAERQAGFPLLRPQDPRASDDSLTEVWIRTGKTRKVALEYTSGLREYVVRSELADPVAFYRTVIAEQEGIGSIRTINGVPALVVPPDEGGAYSGSVEMVLGEVHVVLIGHGDFTLEELLRIAESVR